MAILALQRCNTLLFGLSLASNKVGPPGLRPGYSTRIRIGPKCIEPPLILPRGVIWTLKVLGKVLELSRSLIFPLSNLPWVCTLVWVHIQVFPTVNNKAP